MTTAESNYNFRSEIMRNTVALGQARAVLTVLDGRAVAVPDDVRDRILECRDALQLDTWLRRAGTATTIDDVLREVAADPGTGCGLEMNLRPGGISSLLVTFRVTFSLARSG